MSTKFELNSSEIQELEQKMMKLPNKMEETINQVLHTDGVEIATEEITKLIPNSSWKNRKLKKIHAKTTKWSKADKTNLGFTIKSRGGAANKRGSYGYLVFPNEGRGSHNPVEQRFMERGLQKATPRILLKLNKQIDKLLEGAL